MTDNSINTPKLPGAGGKMSFAVFCLILAAFFPVAYGVDFAWYEATEILGLWPDMQSFQSELSRTSEELTSDETSLEESIERMERISLHLLLWALGWAVTWGIICGVTARLLGMRVFAWFLLGIVGGGIAWAYCIFIGWLTGKNPHILNHPVCQFMRRRATLLAVTILVVLSVGSMVWHASLFYSDMAQIIPQE